MISVLTLQQKYLDQLIEAKSQALFNQTKENLLGEKWRLLLHERVPRELRLKCEFPNENGHTCNSNIQNIYTIESETGRLLKVGSTCLNKVIPVKELDKIEKEIEKLKDIVRVVNRTYDVAPRRTFTLEEKQALLEKAKSNNVLPGNVRALMLEGVPLPEGVYWALHTTLFNLEQTRKQMAEMTKIRQEAKWKWQEKVQNQQKTPPPNQPKYRSYADELKANMEQIGLREINTKGDAKKAAEVGVLTHMKYPASRSMKFWRYSDVIREVTFHFGLGPNKRKDFSEVTIEHAKTFLREQGYQVFGEKEREFLFN